MSTVWLGVMAGVPLHHRDHGLGNVLVSRRRECRAPGRSCGEAGSLLPCSPLSPERGEWCLSGVGEGRRPSMPGRASWLYRPHTASWLYVHDGLGEGVTFPPSSLGLSFPSEFEKGIGNGRSF